MIKWFKGLFKKKEVEIKGLLSNPPAYQNTVEALAIREKKDADSISAAIAERVETCIKNGEFSCVLGYINLNHKKKIDKNSKADIFNWNGYRNISSYSYKGFKNQVKLFQDRGFRVVLRIKNDYNYVSLNGRLDVKRLSVSLDWSKDATKHQS